MRAMEELQCNKLCTLLHKSMDHVILSYNQLLAKALDLFNNRILEKVHPFTVIGAYRSSTNITGSIGLEIFHHVATM